MKKTVNALGDICPIPLVKAKEAIKELQGAGTVEVLVEGFSKRSREQLFGRTEQNKVVVFDKGNHHIGERVWVEITGSSSATLQGKAL